MLSRKIIISSVAVVATGAAVTTAVLVSNHKKKNEEAEATDSVSVEESASVAPVSISNATVSSEQAGVVLDAVLNKYIKGDESEYDRISDETGFTYTYEYMDAHSLELAKLVVNNSSFNVDELFGSDEAIKQDAIYQNIIPGTYEGLTWNIDTNEEEETVTVTYKVTNYSACIYNEFLEAAASGKYGSSFSLLTSDYAGNRELYDDVIDSVNLSTILGGSEERTCTYQLVSGFISDSDFDDLIIHIIGIESEQEIAADSEKEQTTPTSTSSSGYEYDLSTSIADFENMSVKLGEKEYFLGKTTMKEMLDDTVPFYTLDYMISTAGDTFDGEKTTYYMLQFSGCELYFAFKSPDNSDCTNAETVFCGVKVKYSSKPDSDLGVLNFPANISYEDLAANLGDQMIERSEGNTKTIVCYGDSTDSELFTYYKFVYTDGWLSGIDIVKDCTVDA